MSAAEEANMMTEAEQKRAESLVGEFAKRAFRQMEALKRRYPVERWPDVRTNRIVEDSLVRTVKRLTSEIINAAKVKPGLAKKVDALRKKRASLTADLKDIETSKQIRAEVNALRLRRDELEEQCRDLQARAVALGGLEYPPPPEPMVEASENGEGLPQASGIYFVWKNGAIRYVGQSVNLANRCNLRHHAIHPGEWLSYLEFEKTELTWAENFYIGVLRTWRNYGQMGAHQKHRCTA